MKKSPESQFNKFYTLDNMRLYRKLSNIQKEQDTLVFSLDRIFKKNSNELRGPEDEKANPRKSR